MGMDSINDILSWKKPLELFKLCFFIVATRPGAKKRTFNRLMKFPPLKDNVDKISLIETEFDVSSTDIRKNVREGGDIDKMVPMKIQEYIKGKGLFK
jgi:nicotinate-nucleotide adenylyltransferase